MAKITRAEVEHVARLARLELSEDEKERMTAQLDAILGYMDTLNALDTSGVEPTTTVIPMVSVMREDVVRPSLSREDALANAPDREDVFFRVPRIIEDLMAICGVGPPGTIGTIGAALRRTDPVRRVSHRAA